MSVKFNLRGVEFNIHNGVVYKDGEEFHRIRNGGSVVADRKFLAVDGELIYVAEDITADERADALERATVAESKSGKVRVGKGIGVMEIKVPTHTSF